MSDSDLSNFQNNTEIPGILYSLDIRHVLQDDHVWRATLELFSPYLIPTPPENERHAKSTQVVFMPEPYCFFKAMLSSNY